MTSGISELSGDSPAGPPRRRRAGREQLLGYAFLLPSLVLFALFIAWPLGRSVYLSLHGSDLFGGASAYVGLRNYTDMFGSADFARTLLNTLEFVLLTVLPGVLGALVVVLLLEAQIRGVRVLGTSASTGSAGPPTRTWRCSRSP